jgi:hypothetical protein
VHHRSWVRVVPALLVIASACAHHPAAGVSPADSPPVRVEVTNHYALPMEIFAAGAGSSYRLGLVNPEMVGVFVVPQTLLAKGSAEFRAMPTVRGPLFRSGELLLAPGSVVVFMITPQLFNSTATIRP